MKIGELLIEFNENSGYPANTTKKLYQAELDFNLINHVQVKLAGGHSFCWPEEEIKSIQLFPPFNQ